MNETREFNVGDLVAKRQGYSFPGEVCTVFATRANRRRYVVECLARGCEGMLHIFSAKDLRPMTEAEREMYG